MELKKGTAAVARTWTRYGTLGNAKHLVEHMLCKGPVSIVHLFPFTWVKRWCLVPPWRPMLKPIF